MQDFLNKSSIALTLESIAEDEEEQRKEDRRANCGKYLNRYFDIELGTWVAVMHRCDLWRDGFCPRCYDSRKRWLRKLTFQALDKAMDKDRALKATSLDKDEADELCRKLGKANYARRPTKDGDVVFTLDESVEGEEVDFDNFDSLDWDALTDTPEGRNLSGKLGREPPTPLKEGEVEITVPIISVMPCDNIKAIEALAVKRALGEIPDDATIETQEQAQAFIDWLTNLIAENIEEGGGKILNLNAKPFVRRIEISRIFLNDKGGGEYQEGSHRVPQGYAEGEPAFA